MKIERELENKAICSLVFTSHFTVSAVLLKVLLWEFSFAKNIPEREVTMILERYIIIMSN